MTTTTTTATTATTANNRRRWLKETERNKAIDEMTIQMQFWRKKTFDATFRKTNNIRLKTHFALSLSLFFFSLSLSLALSPLFWSHFFTSILRIYGFTIESGSHSSNDGDTNVNGVQASNERIALQILSAFLSTRNSIFSTLMTISFAAADKKRKCPHKRKKLKHSWKEKKFCVVFLKTVLKSSGPQIEAKCLFQFILNLTIRLKL